MSFNTHESSGKRSLRSKISCFASLFLVMGILLSLTAVKSSAEEDVAAFMATMDNASATLRYPAWITAEKYGAQVIVPLGERMEAADRSKFQDLKRAIERIVHNVGRPGADADRKAVAAEMCKLLVPDRSAKVKNEILDLLACIADDSNLAAMEPLLNDTAVREEACRAIQRVPGRAATEMLEKNLEKAPADFQARLLSAIGKREDKSAGPALVKFLSNANGEIKVEALQALAKSGALPPKQMRKHLESIKDVSSEVVRANIRLRFADNLAAQGESARAKKMYESLAKSEVGEQIQIAAQAGLAKLK
jgi:hypothetical protein